MKNNYSNLYQSNYYRQKIESFKRTNDAKGLAMFERQFPLVNTLYTEGIKCIFNSNDNPRISDTFVFFESEIINSILRYDSSAFDILKEAAKMERPANQGEEMTLLDIAVRACQMHLSKMNIRFF